MTAVRTAVPEDAAAIGEIHVEGWRSSYDGLLPASYLADIDVDERIALWRERLTEPEEPDTRVLVVERDGQVLGFIAAGPSHDVDVPPGSAEIRALYLREAAKGQGLATALLEEALEQITVAGHGWVVLNVLEGNTAARSFYEKFGFAFDGTRVPAEIGGRQVFLVRYAAPLPL